MTGMTGAMGMMGKETQCAEYKATEPKFRRRWEVKSGLCEECKGVHGMDGPGVGPVEEYGNMKGVKEGRVENATGRGVVVGVGKGLPLVKGIGKGIVGSGKDVEERGRARSRAVTDPTAGGGPVSVSVPVTVSVENAAGGNGVKGVSGKVVGRRVVRKRIATL